MQVLLCEFYGKTSAWMINCSSRRLSVQGAGKILGHGSHGSQPLSPCQKLIKAKIRSQPLGLNSMVEKDLLGLL